MKKYIIYADSEESAKKRKPICKIKREYEAINFISDVRNLSKYGCMTLEMATDDDGTFRWNDESGSWEHLEVPDGDI